MLTVRVDVPGLAPGVTVLGEKEQRRAAKGGVEQESEMGSSKGPPCGVRVTVYVAD